MLAQFDERSIVVYQAYRPSIGHWATEHGTLGGPDFSFDRMSWIKPNFLWMMYRCGWGLKEDQQVVLAIRMLRTGFDELLREAVPSSFPTDGPYGTRDDWREAVRACAVRLQWDPDHDPAGAKLERRALQLGLRGRALRRFATEWIVGIEDVSEFVAEQRAHALSGRFDRLVTPREDVYPTGRQTLT